MNIVDINIKKYELPLIKPLVIKNHTINVRLGAIITLTDDSGNKGCGEAAPLPGLHPFDLDQVIAQLKNFEPQDISPLFMELLYPSAKTAMEMALFDLRLQSQKAFDKFRNLTLPVNGLVMAQDADLFDAVDALIAEGYISIKIKVARQPLAKDIETIQRLKELIGAGATIRLDANRLWTLDESLEFCNQVAGDQIEYIEEPLADISQYPIFFDSTDMPVAFDETLVEKGVEELDCLDKVKAFVLKPSLLGGLSMTGQFIALALENDIMPVMSCTFGSDLSLRSFALFAAMFGAADIPLGLDTMKWFKHHLLTEGFKVESGRIEIAALVNRPVFNEQLLYDLS
ncbi:MAG: o-succinylbenzoate synthase [Planctomycetota bacterium]|nr:MAG: o-succinylbenzoate synthase [Planctomycetota bacterium]